MFAEAKVSARWPRVAAWLPLVCLPVAAAWLACEWPPWVFMWLLAFSIYAGFKWLTFVDAGPPIQTTVARTLGYLLLWPGMDARAFFADRPAAPRPSLNEGWLAAAKVVFGLLLIGAASSLVYEHPMITGWIGMAGIVFTLHFGLFHLLSVVWRRAGVDARPIMDAPILSSSLSDFWGKRWNLAFRDLAHTYIFRPLVGKLGIAGATMAVFLASGLVHDAVISLPARGGYGLPTLYFAIQGLGVLFERSRLGKRLGTRKGIIGRVYCAAIILGPVFLLFHRPFVERVVVPMFMGV